MKISDRHAQKAWFVVTVLYLLCSVFGCVLYMYLPPFLASIGARAHVYLLVAAAKAKEPNYWPEILTVIVHLFVLAQMGFGALGLRNGKLRIFTVLTVLEVLMTLVLLATQNFHEFFTASGVIVNMGYCVWLVKRELRRLTRRTRKSLKG